MREVERSRRATLRERREPGRFLRTSGRNASVSAYDRAGAGIAGVVMALMYVLTRSLWVPMVLHALVDMNSGRLGYLALRDDGVARSAA